eukprot:GDKJ01062713.1.p1 GENE.GDKJ01062713.1~~GDKJ01062713.1.p1  ORF type:complete len:366 (-),score=15.17 GDKJ01062713.1:1001-2098(-)
MKKYIIILCLSVVSICLHAQQQPTPIKGVWLTNVASNVLDSRVNIKEAVNLCAANGINTIFVVTWNRGYTLYQSKIMQQKFGVAIDPRFKGRDPLQELIEEAHLKNIKVHAWFEFGFASSYKSEGGFILKKYPHWKAIDRDGKLVSKNNFQWMNAFLPEVQNFITSLVLEVVKKYKVDGIQGDDRLPALPSTGGYDAYTKAQYKKEHQGQEPPYNYKDADWLTWRTNRLNNYLKTLYHAVKKTNPNVLVTMAPSIYPWSKEEYLQDWPSWIKDGYVDYVFPQIYRYNLDNYKATLTSTLKYIPADKLQLFYPGLLLKVDDYTPDDNFLQEMININRANTVNGEVFFFYEGMKLHAEFFKKYGSKE